jgi:LPXTG-motif cell wall-anchored protein
MSPSTYTIDQYTSGTEAPYTIAGGTINGLSITTTWIDLPGEIPPDTGSASKNTNMILIIGLIMGLAFYTTRPKRRTRGSLNVLFGEKKRKGDS